MAHERQRRPEPTKRFIIELPLGGNLDRRVVEFIGAVRLLAGGLQAIALSLSTPEDNQQAVVDSLAASLDASAKQQEDALKNFNQSKEN